MTKDAITEDRPMVYTAADGGRIELRVAGRERVFTLTVNGERLLTTVNEQYARTLAYNACVEHNARAADAPAAPTQIVSPLPVAEQTTSGLAGGGAAANRMSEPQARRLARAIRWTSEGQAPRLYRYKGCNLAMLRSLARRGWIELNHPVRPTFGTVNDAGRRALARYEAGTGAR